VKACWIRHSTTETRNGLQHIYTQNDDSGKDDYITDTDIIQWADSDSTFCACWPWLQGVAVGYNRIRHLDPDKQFQAVLWNNTTVRQKTPTVSFVHCVPGHTGWRPLYSAWCDYTGNVLVLINYAADGTQKEAMKQLFVTLLKKHDKMRQTVPHMPIWTSTFQQQQNWSSQDWLQTQSVMKNEN